MQLDPWTTQCVKGKGKTYLEPTGLSQIRPALYRPIIIKDSAYESFVYNSDHVTLDQAETERWENFLLLS